MKSYNLASAPRLEPVKGVEMSILGSGDKMTLIRMVIKPGAVFPEHRHINEQIGICLEGYGELFCNGQKLKVEPGVSWCIPGNEIHSFINGDQETVIIEGWSPPREDYISMAK
jgi:quercetin dioxygenase-like cupin family protein